METVPDIFHEFAHGSLKYEDAIARLQAIGHSPLEAKRMVSEWADGLEAEKSDDELPW